VHWGPSGPQLVNERTLMKMKLKSDFFTIKILNYSFFEKYITKTSNEGIPKLVVSSQNMLFFNLKPSGVHCSDLRLKITQIKKYESNNY
jgi:hypothetical protein